MSNFLETEHLARGADGTDVKQSVAHIGQRGPPLPVGVDLGVLTVLTDVVIKRLSSGRERRDDEVMLVGTAVGEHDGGLVVAAKEIEHVGGKRVVEVGAPECAMVFGVFDDGTRVANEGSVDPELAGDGQGASIAPASAEDRPYSGLGGASHRRGRPRPQCSIRAQQRPVHIECQDLIVRDCHDSYQNVIFARPSIENPVNHAPALDAIRPGVLIVCDGKSRGQGQSSWGQILRDHVSNEQTMFPLADAVCIVLVIAMIRSPVSED